MQPGIATTAVVKEGHVKETGLDTTLGSRDARIVAPDAVLTGAAVQDVSGVGVDGKLVAMEQKEAVVEVLKGEAATIAQKKITDGPVESHPAV